MKRTFQKGEKMLLGASLLAMVSLVAAGWERAHRPRTIEESCRLLVKAMVHQDDAGVKKLTTPTGYFCLQRLIKTGPFDSYPRLGNRLLAEWGNPIDWEETERSSSQDSFGMMTEDVRQGKEYGLSFKSTARGWRLDGYVPMTPKLLKPRLMFPGRWKLDD